MLGVWKSAPVTVQALVARTLAGYDQDRDGAISLATESSRQIRQTATGFLAHDQLTITTVTYRQDRLLQSSDADGDGRVTGQELEAVVRRYDADGDGVLAKSGLLGRLVARLLGLPPSEYERFEAEMGETLSGYSRETIG